METRRERKVVTVLFADLVGFTARAEQLDPEDVEAILRPYHERLRSELERFGGTVEKFIGDAVMALFGAPVAHEDDPERAVRAALAIRDWAREEGEVEVRIAVNTGEALINLGARPDAGETMATGDVINTTARMQSAAPVNGILAGETTQRATMHAIDYRDVQPVEAKGKAEPIPAWEVIEARAHVGREIVSVAAPIVGRERELALLGETLIRVREESAPQLVTLVGVPGIGKSRLVYELMQMADQTAVLTHWRQGRALPYGDGVTFWPLAEIVKAQAGVLETNDDGEVRRKLREAVANVVSDPAESDWIERHLRPLVGLEGGADVGSDRRGEAFAAWRRFFENMAEQRLLVLVFEDLHWADEGLLDFVDHLVDWANAVPILIVCTARPELLERRPGWGGGKLNAATLSLSPLAEKETARLLLTLLDEPLLDARRQHALLSRAGGNPLYAEQYARMAREREDTSELPIPETVQGIIAARLDLLPADDKSLLQDAAVLGRVFWLGGLVDGRARAHAEEQLHALQRKGFVQRARRTSVAGEEEYAFVHVLVRDVAYGQIPRADRAEKHRSAAEWIRSIGRPEDHAEMLAHHYLTALELARASGQPTDDLADHARLALREAGDRALALNAFDSAARFYASALELWPSADDERGPLLLTLGKARATGRAGGEAELAGAAAALAALGDCERAAEAELLLADLAWRKGQRDRTDAHVARAVKALEETAASPAKARTLSEVSRYHALGGRDEDAVRVGRQALEMASALGLDEVRAHALDNIGMSRVGAGDVRGLDDLRRSIEIATGIGSLESVRAYNNLFATTMTIGALDEAIETLDEALREADRFRAANVFDWLRFQQLPVAWLRGRWDELLELMEQLLAELRPRHALTRWCLEARGRVRLARDDIPGALADANESLELAREAKDPQSLHPALSFAAVANLAAEQVAEAASLADELLAAKVADRPTPHQVSPEFDLVWVLVAFGREAEFLAAAKQATFPTSWLEAATAIARGDYMGAAEIYARMANPPNEAYARLRAAERLIEEGRRAEADEQLHRALAFWRSVGATRYIREGEALLAATA
jgi:class 3 adenylate cyclase/tetratricopeptide (TPR) repeat protein